MGKQAGQPLQERNSHERFEWNGKGNDGARGLLAWVEEMVELCEPDEVRWCDGSDAEWNELSELLVQRGTFIRLNPEKHPNSYLAAVCRRT